MTPADRAKRDMARALELAESSEYEDIRKHPHAFICGALEVYLTEAYRQIDLAKKRAAETQSTVDALHVFHGDTEDVIRGRGFDAYRELDGTYTVYSRRQDSPVFHGTEAELLAWVQSDAAEAA